MTRAKSFKLSEPVWVQLTTDHNAPWVEAVYVDRVDTMPGWHEVQVPGHFRHINRFGNEVPEGDPNAIISKDRHIVPSRRIKKRVLPSPRRHYSLEAELQELERTDPEVGKAAQELERVKREIVEKGRSNG